MGSEYDSAKNTGYVIYISDKIKNKLKLKYKYFGSQECNYYTIYYHDCQSKVVIHEGILPVSTIEVNEICSDITDIYSLNFTKNEDYIIGFKNQIKDNIDLIEDRTRDKRFEIIMDISGNMDNDLRDRLVEKILLSDDNNLEFIIKDNSKYFKTIIRDKKLEQLLNSEKEG